MNKKRLLCFTLCGFAFLMSCKKNASPASGSGGGGASLSSTGAPSGLYNGFFLCTNTWLFPNAATGSVEVGFYNTPVSISAANAAPAGTATVTSVTHGTVVCGYVASQGVYFGGTVWSSPVQWSVSGAGSIPSFTFTNVDAVPNYGDAFSLPQTITRNQNLVIPVNNLSGADQITFVVSDGSGISTSVSRGVPVSSVAFLKDSLNKLTAGGGSLQVYAIKYRSQTFSGQNFLFGTCSKTVINSITLQ